MEKKQELVGARNLANTVREYLKQKLERIPTWKMVIRVLVRV